MRRNFDLQAREFDVGPSVEAGEMAEAAGNLRPPDLQSKN
jgi:hypothetical protein